MRKYQFVYFYGMKIHAYQVGGQLRVWVVKGCGLIGVWFIRGLTVLLSSVFCPPGARLTCITQPIHLLEFLVHYVTGYPQKSMRVNKELDL